MIDGNTLIEMGYQPGPWFGKAISFANKYDLRGEDLKRYLMEVSPPPPIDPHCKPLRYFKNISAVSANEKSNLTKVIRTMDAVMRTPTVVTGAIMPDACPAGPVGQIPVGGIVVTDNAIHPSMHGADICCSVAISIVENVTPKCILDSAQRITHFGPGGRKVNTRKLLPRDISDQIKNNKFLKDPKSSELAETHLMTQGDGNHFLFVGQSKNTGKTCMVTHHGSRGLGARLFKSGMQVAEKFRKRISPRCPKLNAWIPFDTQEGKEYWEALMIIREWTRLNHLLIHEEVAKNVGVDIVDWFWNEHNFVFKKDNLFYHAKGATPLCDELIIDSTTDFRIIPLNMGQPILIVSGKATENNLGFAPHGAGRNMSRSQHKRDNSNRSAEEILFEEIRDLDVRFYSGQIDISELPSAYKNAEIVKDQIQQFKLGTIEDEIIPYGCIMAGDWWKSTKWQN